MSAVTALRDATAPAVPVPDELLVVSQWYWPEPIGSAFYSTQLAEWFAAQGSRVTVLTGRPRYPGAEVYAGYRDGRRDEETIDGVRIVRLATATRGDSALGRIRDESGFLLHGLRARAAGCVVRHRHVLSISPSVMAVLLGAAFRLRDGRHLAWVHDLQAGLAEGLGFLPRPLARALGAVERGCLDRADRLATLSPAMAARLAALGRGRPVAVMPIWVDAAAIRPRPRPAGAPPTLLYSGNLGRKQGLEHLLDLAEVLRRERPGVRLLIRGGGTQETILRRAARQRGLDNVTFAPVLPTARLGEGLADGDLHLIPQDPAGADHAVPSKLFNALAAGRPCLATARPGSALWQLGEACAAVICTPPGDAAALARAALGLLDDAARRAELGRRGRAFVVAHHGRERVLGDLAARLLEQVGP